MHETLLHFDNSKGTVINVIQSHPDIFSKFELHVRTPEEGWQVVAIEKIYEQVKLMFLAEVASLLAKEEV